MATLHELLTQGSAISLGPVTVTRTFDKFPNASNCLVLVQDPSVQEPHGIKIWGAASNTRFEVGQSITIQGQGPKGKLEQKEYKGKMEINANDCSVIIGGAPAGGYQQPAQSSPPAHSYAQRPASQAPSGGGGMSLTQDELSRRMDSFLEHGCEMTTRAVDIYVRKGFTREEAIILSAGTHGTYPTSWFLEKGY